MLKPGLQSKLRAADDELSFAIQALIAMDRDPGEFSRAVEAAAEALSAIRLPSSASPHESGAIVEGLKTLAAKARTVQTLMTSAASLRLSRILRHSLEDSGYAADGEVATFSNGLLQLDA